MIILRRNELLPISYEIISKNYGLLKESVMPFSIPIIILISFLSGTRRTVTFVYDDLIY